MRWGGGGGAEGSTPSLGEILGVQMRMQEGWGGQSSDVTAGKGGTSGSGSIYGNFLTANAELYFDDSIILTVSSV